MKDYNAEKIFLTNVLHVLLKRKLLALDNFAGGILKALLAANF